MILSRVPPQNVDAEKSVLGAMLLDKDAILMAEDKLTPEDFYREADAVIFKAILNLSHRGEPADILTVTEELKRMGRLDDVGGVLYINELPMNVISPKSIDRHADIVAGKAKLRRLIDAAGIIAEEAYSELPAARAAAQALGVPLTETTVTAEDFFAANRAIQWYLDEPMPNPAEVPLYFLCKAARQRVKVVLSGEGADELFGGYPLYRQAVWAERWQKMPRAVRRALAALLPGCGLLHRGALPRWQRSARANYVFETTQERDKYLKRDYRAPTPAQRCKPYFDAVRGLDEPTAVQWVDWQTWLPRDILRKADRMSMANSLELRVPFLDRQVLAAAQALPRRYRCTGRRGKIALRAAAARRLPPQLADAPKRGFPVPLADWLRQEKYYALVKAKLTGPAAERFFDTGALCALLDAHRAGKTNAMTKLWAFYCFIEWYEVYFTGKIPPDL